MSGLTVQEASDIADRITQRRERWPDEDEHQGIMVVLLNCGDQFTPVACIGGEWSGTKAELTPGLGIPHCPNGHVLTESSAGRKQLGWVDDQIGY